MRRLLPSRASPGPWSRAVAVAIGGSALAYFTADGRRQRLGRRSAKLDGADDHHRDAGGGRDGRR